MQAYALSSSLHLDEMETAICIYAHARISVCTYDFSLVYTYLELGLIYGLHRMESLRIPRIPRPPLSPCLESALIPIENPGAAFFAK